ncbi:hypothetical protein [Polynucleobacter sp. AP-Capit-er-40B-B4]|uniref:hypothetical protein n=1 Tax=Polynucleobacter sp. AP-Capit-er-40B-B4 TaxID=2576927 RepID=UPI001C0D09C7|nr:hypothetical protein [Polynucleobacter sp. AP-Capit-er-40B-B4]
MAKDIQIFVDPSDNFTEITLTDEECPNKIARDKNYHWLYKIKGVKTGCYGDNGKDGAEGIWFYMVFVDGSYRKGKYTLQQIADAIEAKRHPAPLVPLPQFNYPMPAQNNPAPPTYTPPTNLTPGLTRGNSGGFDCTPNGSGGFYCR